MPRQGAPVIAIPTTAGTGSEVTKVTVITDTERDVKMMMLDVHLLPSVAIVDYELTLSMPHDLTAHVGIDTLTAIPKGQPNPWAEPPMFIVHNNLIAVLVGGSDWQRERVRLAIEAGLQAPGR